MYLSFYGLAEKPFSITPDPRYLFLGGRHAEALAHLVYGISEAGGFIQLTGEVGTGKTTIIRSLLAKQPDNAEIALILNPRMNAPEFMLTLCEELGILLPDDAVGSVKELVDILNRYLLKSHAQGKRVVLIVDEAQNLAPEVLEQVRLLTNLETETQKLLQIILIGQPELRDMLARNDLRQLAQRITGRYHLDPLSREESSAYVKHRLRIAGATTEIFTGGALTEMYRVSGGVPRLLNVIGDRALLGGYSEDRHIITASVVRKAASEVFGRRLTPAWLPWVLGGATAVVVAGVIFAVWQLGATRAMAPAAATPPAASAPAPTATGASPATPPATTPPPAAPPPALADFATLLRNSAAVTDLDGAYGRLFALWSARYVAGSEDACSQALRQGLECLNETGGIEVLRRYNRPALLALEDDTGAVHQTIVVKVQGTRAQLLIGGANHDVAMPELEARWSGDFLILWRPPQLDTRSLTLGNQGEPVRVLRQRLRQWAGQPAEVESSDVFDESLRDLIIQFQRRTGLVADGIAGTRTQALLDAALASAESPLLSAAAP
ncbi:MAG: AAA family ATPase [Gammaproteobacteria bacterium]|jgi:general secretion pathway protein A|nr:AAA family ATPase [Gammaproteobacteria bacterium]